MVVTFQIDSMRVFISLEQASKAKQEVFHWCNQYLINYDVIDSRHNNDLLINGKLNELKAWEAMHNLLYIMRRVNGHAQRTP